MALRSLHSLRRQFAGGASGVLLALLLALGQQHAVLHWLSHAVASAKIASAEEQRVGAADASDFACDECLALSAFGASSPASPWTFDNATPRDEAIAAPPRPGVTSALRLAFRSRAPPTLS